MQLTQKERIYFDFTSRYTLHENINKPMGAIQTP